MYSQIFGYGIWKKFQTHSSLINILGPSKQFMTGELITFVKIYASLKALFVYAFQTGTES